MLPLDSLIAQCAPFVAPQTMSAIVRVESGGNPLAMWNNTTRQRILPPNRAAAIAYLQGAIAAGQKVDVGIAQVDTENFAAYGLTPENAFDACTNLRVGAKILQSDYARAAARFGPGQVALYHAFEAYNSGHLWGDAHYANTVLRSAGIPVYVQSSGKMVYRPLATVFSWSTAPTVSAASPPRASVSAAYVLKW
ncbi:peptidase M56 [Acidithiobacillus caldus]|uniref:Peptidase M56 n=1 Tax=Acidithiobacillus caldus TaxID=33059 RepID=A0A1E7YVQ6_9PROT|nr:peptidase M56 [Acidithiobacillus caldus]